MALTARTLTGNIATLTGGDFEPYAPPDPGTLKAWVDWRGASGIIVDPSVGLRVGGYLLDVQADGSFSIALPDSTEAGVVYEFHATYVDPGTRDTETVAGDFTLTANGVLGDTVPLVTDTHLVALPVAPARTTTQIAAASDPVNTVGKVLGRMIYNSTTNKPLWAGGSTPTAVWRDATGATAHTPS